MQAHPKLAGDRVNVNYQVKEVQLSDREKTVFLEGAYGQAPVVLHLHDNWTETPIAPGHTVNLIAEKTRDNDGRLHAWCTFDTGTA